MTEQEWIHWLEKVPNEDIDGIQERLVDWAEDHADEFCDDMVGDYCVHLIDGTNPREWLENALSTFTVMCLEEEEARDVLVQMYEGALEEVT